MKNLDNKSRLTALNKKRDKMYIEIIEGASGVKIFEIEEKIERVKEALILENADEFFNSYEYYNKENANEHLQDDLDSGLIQNISRDELLDLRERYGEIQDYMIDFEERFIEGVETDKFGIRHLKNMDKLKPEEIEFLIGDLSEEKLLNNI